MTVRDGGRHFDAADFRRMAVHGGAPPPAERRHLADCPECREEFEMIQMLMAVAGSGRGLASACPTPERLVEHAEGLLGRSDMVAVDAHLTDCRSCAIELELLARGHDAAGQPPTARPQAKRAPRAELGRMLRHLVSFDMPPLMALATRGAASAPAPAHLALAIEAQVRGDHERVLALLLAPAEAGSASPEVRICLGASLRALDRAEEAVPHLEAALKAQPKRAECAWQLAQALLQVARAEEAAGHLRRVSRLQGPRRRDARALAARVEQVMEGAEE